MSFQAMAWAIEQDVGDPLAKFLLIMIANYAGETGEAWPSQNKLAADTGMHRNSVQNKTELLVERGFIDKRLQATPAGGYNVYTLQMGGTPRVLGAHHVPVAGTPHVHKPINEPINPSPPARAQRATQIPEGWQPSEEDLAWASAAFPNLDIRDEADQFRDYFLAKGTTHVRWGHAFRNWVRRSARAPVRGTAGATAYRPRSDRTADNDRRIREYLGDRGYPVEGQELPLRIRQG